MPRWSRNFRNLFCCHKVASWKWILRLHFHFFTMTTWTIWKCLTDFQQIRICDGSDQSLHQEHKSCVTQIIWFTLQKLSLLSIFTSNFYENNKWVIHDYESTVKEHWRKCRERLQKALDIFQWNPGCVFSRRPMKLCCFVWPNGLFPLSSEEWRICWTEMMDLSVELYRAPWPCGTNTT